MAESRLPDTLAYGLQTLIEDIIQQSRNAGQMASGHTYSSIKYNIDVQNDRIIGTVTAPEYFSTLITGRGPGGVPYDMPRIIQEWATYKGIVFGSIEELRRFSWAVTQIIKKEGSELFRNNLYIDILDSPVERFEVWLKEQIGSAVNLSILEVLRPTATESHGFII